MKTEIYLGEGLLLAGFAFLIGFLCLFVFAGLSFKFYALLSPLQVPNEGGQGS